MVREEMDLLHLDYTIRVSLAFDLEYIKKKKKPNIITRAITSYLFIELFSHHLICSSFKEALLDRSKYLSNG